MRLELGDVLLMPKDVPDVSFYNFIAKHISKAAADFLAKITDHRYIHAEMYLTATSRGFITIAAWPSGVHVLEYPLYYLGNYDVYRHVDINDEVRERIKSVLLEFLGLRYDFQSFILNAMVEVLSFGNEVLEKWLENWLNLDTPQYVICSELIARIFEKVGLQVERKAEFVTPDDLGSSPNLIRII